jgi:hypothetical protein
MRAQIMSSQHQHKHDTIGRFMWAGILIYAGLVWLADSAGMLPGATSAGAWDWIKMGAGGLMLLGAVARALAPDHPEPGFWQVAISMGLILWGGSGVFGFDIGKHWWPIALIVAGLWALLRGLRH